MYAVRAYFIRRDRTKTQGEIKEKTFLMSMETSFDFHPDRRFALPLSREMAHKVINFLRRNTLPTDYGSLTWLKTVSVVKLKDTPRKVKHDTDRKRVPVRTPRRDSVGEGEAELALS